MGGPRFSQGDNPCLCPVLLTLRSPLVPSLCPCPAQPQRKGFCPGFSSSLPRPRGWLHSAFSAFLPQLQGMCERDGLSKNDLMQGRIRK